MAWIEPKVNWTSNEFFEYEDWKRIVGNLEYVYGLLGSPFTWLPLSTNGDKNSYPFVEDINNYESNMENAYLALGKTLSIKQPAKTWYPVLDSRYTSNPSYVDFNRWENLVLGMRNSIMFEYTLGVYVISGTARFGNDRTLQRFSRGVA